MPYRDMIGAFDHIWSGALAFAFYYPLLMAWIWIAAAWVFWWRRERGLPPLDHPPMQFPPPPVSVLIPCYNEGENAEETIQAALALDYPDFEVIAINDGSRDNTGEVL